MTTPKLLSAAAQAVYEAAHKAWVTEDDPEGIAAATIRAAADQLKMPDDLGLYSNAYWAGYINAKAKLLAIATELEGSDG